MSSTPKKSEPVMPEALASAGWCDGTETARRLGLKSGRTLANWRTSRRFAKELPHYKIGRKVLYKLADIEAFIAARAVAS